MYSATAFQMPYACRRRRMSHYCYYCSSSSSSSCAQFGIGRRRLRHAEGDDNSVKPFDLKKKNMRLKQENQMHIDTLRDTYSKAQHNTTRQGWMDGWMNLLKSIDWNTHTHAPRLLLLLPSSSLLFHCAVLCCSALFCSETDAQVTHAHTWPAARPLPLPSCSFVRSFVPCNNASVQSLTSERWVWSKSL